MKTKTAGLVAKNKGQGQMKCLPPKQQHKFAISKHKRALQIICTHVICWLIILLQDVLGSVTVLSSKGSRFPNFFCFGVNQVCVSEHILCHVTLNFNKTETNKLKSLNQVV